VTYSVWTRTRGFTGLGTRDRNVSGIDTSTSFAIISIRISVVSCVSSISSISSSSIGVSGIPVGGSNSYRGNSRGNNL